MIAGQIGFGGGTGGDFEYPIIHKQPKQHTHGSVPSLFLALKEIQGRLNLAQKKKGKKFSRETKEGWGEKPTSGMRDTYSINFDRGSRNINYRYLIVVDRFRACMRLCLGVSYENALRKALFILGFCWASGVQDIFEISTCT